MDASRPARQTSNLVKAHLCVNLVIQPTSLPTIRGFKICHLPPFSGTGPKDGNQKFILSSIRSFVRACLSLLVRPTCLSKHSLRWTAYYSQWNTSVSAEQQLPWRVLNKWRTACHAMVLMSNPTAIWKLVDSIPQSFLGPTLLTYWTFHLSHSWVRLKFAVFFFVNHWTISNNNSKPFILVEQEILRSAERCLILRLCLFLQIAEMQVPVKSTSTLNL